MGLPFSVSVSASVSISGSGSRNTGTNLQIGERRNYYRDLPIKIIPTRAVKCRLCGGIGRIGYD